LYPDLTIGGVRVGLYLATRFGFLVLGILVAVRLNRRLGIAARDTVALLLIGFPAGVLGAHLLAVFEAGGYAPGDAGPLYFWRDHSAIFGGVLGGIGAGALYTRWRGISLRRVLDGGAPVMALGEGITRVGCFLAGCCHGLPTRTFLGVRFPRESPVFVGQVMQGQLLPDAAWSLPTHPTQLYAAVFGFVLCAFLLRALRHREYDGQVFCLFLFAYGIWRFLLFYLRADPGTLVVLGLYGSQLWALAAVAAAVVLERRWRARPVALQSTTARPPRG
jgi:phosphatidylglycerol:prolipoprotein diacylglycerol transferase